jgi:hypothetical protein
VPDQQGSGGHVLATSLRARSASQPNTRTMNR